MIRQPFLLMSPKVEKQFAASHLDKEIGFSFLGAFLLISAGPPLVLLVTPFSGEKVFLFCLFLAMALVIWAFATSGRRFMNRQVMPGLVAALSPLKPSGVELQTVLAELKQFKHKIGSKVHLADLQAKLS
jgi:hypothetical protein